MDNHRKKQKIFRSALSPLVASLAVGLLFAWLASTQAIAAPRAAGIGIDPRLEAITVTASCPISDTAPGDAITKTIYYSSALPSYITLTVEISGTPALTLSAGAAFGQATRTYTSTGSPWTEQVTYTTNAASFADVSYSATNTHTNQTGIAITYIQDITAPAASITEPESGYVTGTQVIIGGTAQDNAGGSGVWRVQVATDTVWVAATGASEWSYTWHLPQADGVVYTVSARAQDYVRALQSPAATVAVTVDNVLPANPSVVTTTNGTVTNTWINDNTVPISWTAVTDGSGVVYHYRWSQSQSTEVTAGDTSIGGTTVPGTGLLEGDNWFHLRTRDGANNWALTTVHLGPFRVDTISPTVSISSPASGAVLTSTLLPTFDVTGAADDERSGLTQLEINTGSGWTPATGTTSWTYAWTLPIADGLPYTLSARTTDNAGNVRYSTSVAGTIDTVIPANPSVVTATDGTLTNTWINDNTVPVSWTAVTDGSGVVYHYRWSQAQSTEVTAGDTSIGGTTVPGTGLLEGDNWFHLRARDGASNWAPTTVHLGPFRVDTISPTVSISSPASGAVLTSTLMPTFAVTGAADDERSGFTQVQINTGSGWTPATGTTSWTYAWALPITDSVPYTLSARTTDNAGNVRYSSPVAITVDTVAPARYCQMLWIGRSCAHPRGSHS